VKELVEPFTGGNCIQLANKPKLFFIQVSGLSVIVQQNCVLWGICFLNYEVLQMLTSRNHLEAGTNESYPNYVVLILLLLLFVVVVSCGDGDKVENSLIPLSESVILLNINV
jgi:hypothetical protein